MSESLIKLSEIKSKEDFEKIIVAKYLGFSIKKVMIDNIIEFCKIPQNNLVKIDYARLEMVKTISIITEYTNIEIPENIISAYDYIKENKIDKYIFEKINQDEIMFINNTLDSEIKQINDIDNSLQGVLSKSLNDIIEKIPDEKAITKILKEVPKSINKIKPETLVVLKNIFMNIQSNNK
jgi:hypothetical protein